MAIDALLTLNDSGLYCAAGDFYIDPWRPVSRAVITHAHSDHARFGSDRYLTVKENEPLLRWRLGAGIDVQTVRYGESITIGGARVSLLPAGHILGSSQIRIEVAGQVAVVTGDYKLQSDPTCAAWEPVRCHRLVTESTFGLPAFLWPDMAGVMAEVLYWWRQQSSSGRACVLLGYSLGKSQRVLAELTERLEPEERDRVYVHGALIQPTQIYRQQGIVLIEPRGVSQAPKGIDWHRALVLAPPSAQHTPWMRRFGDASVAMASGWMAIRGTRRRRSVDRGFVISDHVDWFDLLRAIDACQPQQVWATHGFSQIVARYLNERGYEARSLETRFEDEGDAAVEEAEPTAP